MGSINTDFDNQIKFIYSRWFDDDNCDIMVQFWKKKNKNATWDDPYTTQTIITTKSSIYNWIPSYPRKDNTFNTPFEQSALETSSLWKFLSMPSSSKKVSPRHNNLGKGQSKYIQFSSQILRRVWEKNKSQKLCN